MVRYRGGEGLVRYRGGEVSLDTEEEEGWRRFGKKQMRRRV